MLSIIGYGLDLYGTLYRSRDGEQYRSGLRRQNEAAAGGQAVPVPADDRRSRRAEGDLRGDHQISAPADPQGQGGALCERGRLPQRLGGAAARDPGAGRRVHGAFQSVERDGAVRRRRADRRCARRARFLA